VPGGRGIDAHPADGVAHGRGRVRIAVMMMVVVAASVAPRRCGASMRVSSLAHSQRSGLETYTL